MVQVNLSLSWKRTRDEELLIYTFLSSDRPSASAKISRLDDLRNSPREERKLANFKLSLFFNVREFAGKRLYSEGKRHLT